MLTPPVGAYDPNTGHIAVKVFDRNSTPADNTIVRKIADVDSGIGKADSQIAELRQSVQALAQRRLEIEAVRDRFRTSGFDHPNVQFGNERDIGGILGQVLEGAVRSGILWDLLRGGFSTRPSSGQPGFGSPTFPFPFPRPGGGAVDGNEGARGGEWRKPGTNGGWSPPFDSGGGGGSGRDDSSGGSGSNNDDFSTGGTF